MPLSDTDIATSLGALSTMETMSVEIQRALIAWDFQQSQPLYILILGFAITFFLGATLLLLSSNLNQQSLLFVIVKLRVLSLNSG